jgi:hypothetical protein
LRLKSETARMSYEADAKLALLREVIRRVQSGEEVDIRKELGTGDPVKEKEWEDVLREIEDDATFGEKLRRRRQERQEKLRARREEREKSRQEQKSTWSWGRSKQSEETKDEPQPESRSDKMENRKPAFY